MSALLALLLVLVPPAHVAPGTVRAPMYTPAQLDDAGLSAAAFRVFGRVCRRWTQERGCYESKEKMRKGCHLGRDAFYAALRELEARRFIVRSGRGPGARIDWRPPSEWLDVPEGLSGLDDETPAEGLSGSDDQTPEVYPDPMTEVYPDPMTEGLSGSDDHKGIPPKGVHEGSCLSTTTTARGPDGTAPPSVVVDDGGGDGKAVDPDRDAKNTAWKLLADRGVADAVALAAEHWAAVPQAVELYDRKLAAGDVDGPGWLTGALRRGFRPQSPTPARQAATRRGPLPEAVNGQTLARELAEAEVASPDTVAAAMAEAEAAIAEGSRRRAATASRKRERVRAADLAPTPDDELATAST